MNRGRNGLISWGTVGMLAVPFGFFAVIGGIFALWKPNVILSASGSLQAIGWSLLAAVLAAALAVGLWALTSKRWVGALAGLIPVLLFLGITILPAFKTSKIDEDFPVAAAPSASDSPAAEVSPGTTPSKPAAPVSLGTGEFTGIDHTASGRATLYRLPDGGLVVRLENFDVEPGPDYQVHLVSGLDAERPAEGTMISKLRANQGNQNYRLPDGFKVGKEMTVLIWCRAFAVPVANASLR